MSEQHHTVALCIGDPDPDTYAMLLGMYMGALDAGLAAIWAEKPEPEWVTNHTNGSRDD